MDRYILVHTNYKGDIVTVKDLKGNEPSVSDTRWRCEHICRDISVAEDQHVFIALVSSNSIQDADWKLVKSNDRLPDVLESAMIDHEKHVDSQETVITSADKIHDLANRLPIKGSCLLDVVLNVVNTSNEFWDDVNLLGAVLRLVEWHNAHVTFLCRDIAVVTDDWADTLHARVVTAADPRADRVAAATLWRGAILTPETEDGVKVTVPGFALLAGKRASDMSPTDCLGEEWLKEAGWVDDHMTILGEFDKRTVPPHCVSSLKLKLCTNFCTVKCESVAEQATKLLEYLNEEPVRCLLVRLEYADTCDVSACDSTLSTTEEWKERVTECTLQHQQGCRYEGPRQCRHLLLIGSDEREACNAYILSQPQDFTPEFVQLACTIPQVPSADAGEACDDAAVEDMLRGLPQLSASQAARMHDAVQSACISACRQRSAEHGRDSLTRGQHRAMMSAITMETLRAFLPQLPLTILNDVCPNEEVSSAAASTDPGDWPERAWLRHREKQRETLERYASEDSLMCAPPPPVQQDVEFDILANLGLFTEEGAGVSDACSPLKLKRRQVTGLLQAKALTWDKRTAEWPDCLDCHSHNVFYNRGRRTEKYEQRIADTALRSVQGETATTQPSLQRPARRTASQRHLSSNAVAISRTKHNRQTHRVAAAAAQPSRRVSPSDRPSLPRRSPRKVPHVRQTTTSDGGNKGSGSRESGSIPLRRSPRKMASGGSGSRESGSIPVRRSPRKMAAREAAGTQMEKRVSKRSPRRMAETGKLLRGIIAAALEQRGVARDHARYRACMKKLYAVSGMFIRDLKRNVDIVAEMTKIVANNAAQVIEFEMQQ